ncbi:MAG TPA: DUF2817 domain-containing protein [Candidatus Saccharimonadales bacterium]|nr:DUF2817 domain-containing protein [Candidatus Saccharimonadales bacterium]
MGNKLDGQIENTDWPATKAASSELNMLEAAFRLAVDEQYSRFPREEAAFRRMYARHQRWAWAYGAKYRMLSTWRAVGKSMHAHRKTFLLTSAGSVIVLLAGGAGLTFLLPRPMHYSFSASAHCAASPAFLPSSTAVRQTNFTIRHVPSLTLFHTTLYSSQVCVTPIRPLQGDHLYLAKDPVNYLGLRFTRQIKVITGSLPSAMPVKMNSVALPLIIPAVFKLTAPDTTFGYELAANSKTTSCQLQGTMVRCLPAKLQLAYGSHYSIRLIRTFQGQSADTVLTRSVQTMSATSVTASSIAPGGTVYDSPNQLTLTTNNALQSIGTVSLRASLNGVTQDVPVHSSFKNNTITVSFASALPRHAALTLHLDQLTAVNSSQLEAAYSLPFTTSGGPKVTGVNIAATNVDLRPSVVISFDQPLLSNQAASGLVTLAANGTAQPISASISGNNLIITLSREVPVCARLNLATTAGVQNSYGISGDGAWSFSARARCYTTFSLGASARGRPITAYQFGSGSTLIVYMAAMHGNESNTSSLLQQWTRALNADPDRIPSDHTLVVIPEVNPDGVTANIRQNADNIDLNRNFPANNWQTVVTEPGGNGQPTNQGGSSPLSEPESRAIADYIQAHRPRLVLTYHSAAAVVEANDAGDSDALGATYAKLSAYKNVPTFAIGDTFDYSTTGAMEDWMHDKLGLPALVIELRTMTSSEYNTNIAAMWAMTRS